MPNNINKFLRKRKKSQGWLAQRTGLKHEYVNRLVKDNIPDPRVSTARKIAKALGCFIEDLWN